MSEEITQMDRFFDFSLSSIVSGIDAEGQQFKEKTHLSTISSQRAVFLLKNKVMIGSDINLFFLVPQTLFLEKQLNIFISGKVTLITLDSQNRDKQFVTLQLNKKFKILPISLSQ